MCKAHVDTYTKYVAFFKQNVKRRNGICLSFDIFMRNLVYRVEYIDTAYDTKQFDNIGSKKKCNIWFASTYMIIRAISGPSDIWREYIEYISNIDVYIAHS